MRVHWYLITFIAAFSLTVAANYRSPLKQEVVVILGSNCYHIHHWMIVALAVAVGIAGANLRRDVLLMCVAAGAGVAMEGAMFSDWWQVKEDCERAFTTSPLAFIESGLSHAKHA